MKLKALHITILTWLITISLSLQAQTTVRNLSCNPDIDIITLDGHWDFYWEQLLTPEQIRDSNYPHISVYVPGSWTKYVIDSAYLPSYGYATYHLRLLVPPQRLYSIKIFDVFSAFKLWVNDSLCTEVGKVSEVLDEYKPHKQTQIITFFAKNDTIDIVIQIANYSHRKAGLVKAPYFGNPQKILAYSELKIAFDFLLFGGLLIFSIFHFWLFFYYQRYYETLFFAISTFAAAFYTFFDQELIITEILPKVPWEWIYKGDYLTDYSRVLFLGLYFFLTVKNYVSKYWIRITQVLLGIIAAMIVLVIFTPVYIYSFTLKYFLIATAIIYVFGLYGFIRKTVKERQAINFIPLSGYIILGLTIINDFLIEINAINGLELSNFGLFIFVTTQSIVLAQKHSKIYKTAQRLASHFEKLDQIKSALMEIPFDDYRQLLLTLAKYFKAQRVLLFDMTSGFAKPMAGVNKGEYLSELKNNVLASSVLMEFIELALSIDEPLLLSDRNKLISYLKTQKKFSAKSLLITRLGSRNRPMAVLYMEKNDGYFTIEQKRILKLTTTHISAIISNILMFNNLNEINKNLMNIVKQRTSKIEEQNKELELRTVALDEKIEELRVTAEIISEMNQDLREQQEVIEKKNQLLREQTELLKQQKALVDELNRQITDSVNYARRIQLALLYSETNLPKFQHYIIYMAQQVVSGDFWWVKDIGSLPILVFGDTGMHGVAGAFMSVLSFSILNELTLGLSEMNPKDIEPDVLIREFFNFMRHLKIQGWEKIKLSVFVFSHNEKQASVWVDGNFVYLLSEAEIRQIHATEQTIKLQLQNYNQIVCFTDGFIKELIRLGHISNPDEVQSIINNLTKLGFEQQKYYIENLLMDSAERSDDVLIIGIKI